VSLQISRAEDVLVDADYDKLKQCLVNLVKNSLDAVEQGGIVQLSCRQSGEGAVEIEVYDNGPGIELESQKKLFSPFFTTKENGTGLGLSAVQKIVAAHGGQIEVKSDPEKARLGLATQGTQVIIRIPTN
jgi:signal transduction histidine kinase